MSLQYYVLLENEVEESDLLSIYTDYRSKFQSKGLLEIIAETLTQAIIEEDEDPEWAESYFDWHAKTQITINTSDGNDVNDESLYELFGFLSCLLDKITGAVGFYVTGSIIYFERMNSELLLYNYPEY